MRKIIYRKKSALGRCSDCDSPAQVCFAYPRRQATVRWTLISAELVIGLWVAFSTTDSTTMVGGIALVVGAALTVVDFYAAPLPVICWKCQGSDIACPAVFS